MEVQSVRLRSIAILTAALALAACGEAPEAQPETVESAPAEAAPAQSSPEADGETSDAGEASTEGAPAADTQSAALIPARFQGVWDYVDGTCAPESDLRMEISGGEILFYESIGMVTAAAAEGADVIVTLAMEGEGEVWEQKTRLSLIAEGDAAETVEWLATSDGDAPKVPDEYPSKRCEG